MLRLCWGYAAVMPGLYWGYTGLCRGYAGVMLELYWGYARVMLAVLCWGYSWVILAGLCCGYAVVKAGRVMLAGSCTIYKYTIPL